MDRQHHIHYPRILISTYLLPTILHAFTLHLLLPELEYPDYRLGSIRYVRLKV